MFISQCSGYNNENMRVPYQSHIYYAILFITLYDDDGYQNRAYLLGTYHKELKY